MAHPQGQASHFAAIALLDYIHAPVVGFYYLTATAFGICVLQKSKPLPLSRRRLAILLALLILAGYVAELLYYYSQSLSKATYHAPQHAAIRCLGSILVWIPLSFSLFKGENFRWHPYFGAFVLQFVLESSICMLQGVDVPFEDRYSNFLLAVSCLRSAASLILTIDGSLILLQRQGEKGTNKEGQSLLGNHPNGSTTQVSEKGYGSTPRDSSDDDDDKEIKKKQAKRLEEQGGWLGYLKGFAIFLPCLFPRDDWKVMLCLSLRIIHLILGRVFNLLTPRQFGIFMNKLSAGTHTMPWYDIGLWVFFIWINSHFGLGLVNDFSKTVIENKAYERITLMAYKHLMALSMDFHTSKDSGEVLKAVDQASSLPNLCGMVLFDVCPILIDLVVSMYYVSVLFDAYMAFIILYLGLAYISVGFIFTTWSQPKSRVYAEKRRRQNATLNETIHNWQTVVYFNRSPFEHERYGKIIRSAIMARYTCYYWSMGGYVVQQLLNTLGFAACCIFATFQIISGAKPVGNLVTLIAYWQTIMSPIDVMSSSYREISRGLINAERLLQLLSTKPTISDREDAQDLVVKSGKVEFKDVDFSYDPRGPIIKGVSLSAEGGQTIAFVGETGGGKSTMLKLLFRFYDVTGGSIMIDGQDLRSVTQASVREALGLVPQDPALFNQTIRQNVRYARLDATDAEIEKACQEAAIHDDIVSFPDGYNSEVGERGVRLSGGQLQRIAIARVLLKGPKIVLLDEATSAIDLAIEAQIQEAFRRLSKGRTSFVIAHRLSTIVNADQILVVDKGEIKERGTHMELLELGGKYAELWTKQTAGNIPTVNPK